MIRHFPVDIPAANSHAESPINRTPIQRCMPTVPLGFKQKVKLSFDKSQYTVKSAETRDELLQALSLRYQVFHREYGRNLTGTDNDYDELDFTADHLVVIDRTSQRVVGNYRLIASRHSPRFYSQGEFCLSEFLPMSGGKLELSRSCVHPGYRSGIVMQLLWRGVIQYMTAIGARYLFGCTSVKTIQKESICRLVSVLDERNAFTDRYGVEPLAHCCAGIQPGMDDEIDRLSTAEDLMPPIMKAYLRAGAQLCRNAAIDMDFQCADFFTILDLEDMRNMYARKYLA